MSGVAHYVGDHWMMMMGTSEGHRSQILQGLVSLVKTLAFPWREMGGDGFCAHRRCPHFNRCKRSHWLDSYLFMVFYDGLLLPS
jgi:hypothetical protein